MPLLDCGRLRHWRPEQQFDELFTGKRDYRRWLGLEDEPQGTVGKLEPEWNDFDRLTAGTKMLHMTRRATQPWKTGLPVDFLPVEQFPAFPPFGWAMRARRKLFGAHAFLGRYRKHPDPRQGPCSSPCCGSASSAGWSPSRSCARRWRATTCVRRAGPRGPARRPSMTCCARSPRERA